MELFDAHIHDFGGSPDPAGLLARLEAAGISGGCVFSDWPQTGPFANRLERVLAWCEGYPDRLFPVMWIHPYEENILENIHLAVRRGICAFKMICTDYYVSEPDCIAVLEEIAKTGKPVFFHSGILWGSTVSSHYNRPLHWEALLRIKGLRFSMGHCSWPWVDECVALYGEFANAHTTGDTAEMFFDTTRGTPEIYRRELLTKLYFAGYDTGDNVFFGTDASALDYSSSWSSSCAENDRRLLDALGVSKRCQENYFRGNLLRFLGKTDAVHQQAVPTPDNASVFTPIDPSVRQTIEKWYAKLEFPAEYDEEFHRALNEIPISDAITAERYDLNCTDGRRNLLSWLFLCEQLARRYAEKSIPEKILLDTLKDLIIWTDTWTEIKGQLSLHQLDWLIRHMQMRLFHIGTMQFCMAQDETGRNVMEVHVPAGSNISREACLAAMEQAKAFFARYFPEFEYDRFTAHSWLLDDTLQQYLPESSNIRQFRSLFTLTHREPSWDILRRLFRFDTNIRNLRNAVCVSVLAQQVKKAALGGTVFYEATGYRLK